MSVKIAERLQRVRSFGERLIPLGPGVIWFSNPELGTGLCFPITKLGYRVRLSGPTGAVETFLSYVNPTTQPQQAYFLFPLDRDVTPVKVRVKHGAFMMETEVRPNAEDIEEAPREPLPVPLARLFQGETEKVLALNLGVVKPGDEVSLQILYACFVADCGEEGRGFSFRLPLMASRALTTLDPNDCEQTALASGLERNPSVAISILLEASDLQPGRICSSQVCGTARQPNGDVAVEFDRSKPLEPRDFVLDYQLWAGPRPKAWLRSQGRHFLLNFFPPAVEPPSQPRRLVFLVDGSEEMNNVGKDRCQACIAGVLNGLDANDTFALVTFNRDVAGFKSGDFVETRYVNDALNWLKEYAFGGVADLKALLERVVKLPRQNDSVLSIILVTAGRLGNEPELYRLLQNSREMMRFFPVVLGRKADPHFARAASKATGGVAFRALNEESISRVSERLLEETRQPVLDVIGISDRGLGFQGDSLTPKYPSGLSAHRPINILGVHTGTGGVEAGGKSAHGPSWSEPVEPKEVFHKVLPVVWAQVKAGELDDEARMLDRAERGILKNVVRSLSADYFLSNAHTAVVVRDNSGAEPRLAAHVEPWRWYKAVETADANAKSANELLEEQRESKGIKGGRSVAASRGGLKMKDNLGKSSAATVFGSKLGHQNRLAGSVKDGLFSKPMLGSGGRGDYLPPRAAPVSASAGRPGTVAGGPSLGSQPAGGAAKETFGAPKETLPPTPEPDDILESGFAPSPPSADPIRASLSPTPPPTIGMSRPPTIGMSPPPSIGETSPSLAASSESAALGEAAPLANSQRPFSTGGSATPTLGNRPPTLGNMPPTLGNRPPTLGNRPPTLGGAPPAAGEISPPIFERPQDDRESGERPPSLSIQEPAASAAQPRPIRPISLRKADGASPTQPSPQPTLRITSEVAEPARPALPTPRDLAARISAQARTGNPEERAKTTLRKDVAARQALMNQMRQLHAALGGSNDVAVLTQYTDAVLWQLAELAVESELLIRAYGMGYQGRAALTENLTEAKEKLKLWLSRFAKLF